MNLNYAIFRSEPIYTLNDLAQIGSHNKREKQAYNSNPDIDISKSNENITLVPLNCKYVKGFHEKTKEYKKQCEKQIEKTRKDRRKTYTQMLNNSKNVVADELLFTATHQFFNDMSKDDIKKWADTCMDFVYNDLGYTKDQVLHSVVHMDEKTPHIHCVVIPLTKRFDKRSNEEKWTISKKQYIKDKIHLSSLQDKYHKRLTDNGFDLERGIVGSDAKHVKIKEYKKLTYRLEKEITYRNANIGKAMEEFNEKMKSSKNIPFDKKHIIIETETFDSMKKVIKETEKALTLQPKIDNLFNQMSEFTQSHQSLEKENKSMNKEINSLKTRNNKLTQESNKLNTFIDTILTAIKKFLRALLEKGNQMVKGLTIAETLVFYDKEVFNEDDVIDIAKNTDSEDELFNYIGIEKETDFYYQNEESYDKDDFDLSR